MTILFILITILLFGALIAIHEFGHFIAAKTLGVRVEEFAIGMGPKLLSRTRGETTYSLRALPIGGFCSMEGEEEASDDPRSFSGKPAWKKFIILVAGAFLNFVTGLVILLVLFSVAGSPSCCPATNSTASTGTASISRAMRFFSWAGRGRMWPSRCSGTAGGSIWALCTCPTVPSPTRAASRA